jgi:hypothetical protein
LLPPRPDRRVSLLVLADEQRVGRITAEIVANRVRARPRVHMRLSGGAGVDVRPLDLAVVAVDDVSADDLDSLLAAREVVVTATGAERAQAVGAMLAEPPSPAMPASLLRSHPRLTVVCDRPAAGALEPSPHWASPEIVIVLGHREPGISFEHRISAESLDRLHLAERLTRHHHPRAVLLTGYTTTGGLSEAEQMAAQWTLPEVAKLLENAGRNTAGNAACSLPLILALGGVRHVTVVTSAWHVRAPYFFLPYRRFGLGVSFRFARSPGRWREMLRHEAREARYMRAERRQAYAEMALSPY